MRCRTLAKLGPEGQRFCLLAPAHVRTGLSADVFAVAGCGAQLWPQAACGDGTNGVSNGLEHVPDSLSLSSISLSRCTAQPHSAVLRSLPHRFADQTQGTLDQLPRSANGVGAHSRLDQRHSRLGICRSEHPSAPRSPWARRSAQCSRGSSPQLPAAPGATSTVHRYHGPDRQR